MPLACTGVGVSGAEASDLDVVQGAKYYKLDPLEIWLDPDDTSEHTLTASARNIKCKNVWVWKDATCHAKSEACKNLCCMITKSRPVLTKSGGSFSCRIGMREMAQNLSC